MSVPWVVLEAVELVEALHPLLIRILGKVSFSLTLLMLVVLEISNLAIKKIERNSLYFSAKDYLIQIPTFLFSDSMLFSVNATMPVSIISVALLLYFVESVSTAFFFSGTISLTSS